MPKILISDKLDAEGKKVLELKGIECDENTSLSPEELKTVIADYDGIIVRSRYRDHTHPFDLKLVELLAFGNSELIAESARGYHRHLMAFGHEALREFIGSCP